jgi:RimJ/RimL family protein N-acetyltransferase
MIAIPVVETERLVAGDGLGYWIVHERASGRFVGEVGFADWRRAMEPPLDGAPELGWALAPWCWGRGYATEAVVGALAWGDAHLAATRSVCIIDVDNRASRRVAEKAGFREACRTTYHDAPIFLCERPFVRS